MNSNSPQRKKTVVLHIINSFEYGGAEVLLRNFAEYFSEPEMELVLVYIIGTGTLVKNRAIPYPIYDLSDVGKFSYLSFVRLIRIIRRHKVTIIHTHDPQSGVLGRIAARFCGVRIIVTTRHNPELIGNHPRLYRIEEWFLARSSRVIAISQAVRKKLVTDKIVDDRKITVIPNGVDLKLFQDDHPDGQKPAGGTMLIGSVGRLHRQKGFDILIRAAAELKRRGRLVTVRIVGKGEQEQELQALIRSLDVSDVVSLTGAMDPCGVKEFLRSLDLFVLPSRWEGFGISLVEAMAMGKPAIASRIDGIPEIIDDGVNGMLFEPENHEDLASKIEMALDNPELCRTMATRAREKAIARYSMEMYVSRTAAVYGELIKEG